MSLLKFRNALIVMGVFLAVIWVLQVFNAMDSYRLDIEYGIIPRNVDRLGEIFTAPFLHFGWAHIEANSVPLFVLGVLAAYRSLMRFAFASLIIAVASGMTVWLFQSYSVTVGASGIVFGYFGYVLLRGIFDRNLLDIGIGLLVGLIYGYILVGVIPGTPGISWLGHAGGLVGGVLAAYLLRTAPPLRRAERKPVAAPAGAAPRPASKSVDDLLRELKEEGL